MGQISKALGQGTDFDFEGTTYKISPWNYDIQGQMERYLEGEAFRAFRRTSQYLTEEERRETLSQLQKDITAGLYSFGSDVVAKALSSLPHMKHLLWLQLRPNHPDLKKDVVERMFETELAEVTAKMAEANADPTAGTTAPAA